MWLSGHSSHAGPRAKSKQGSGNEASITSYTAWDELEMGTATCMSCLKVYSGII